MKKIFFNRKLVMVSVLMMMLVMVTAVVYADKIGVDNFNVADQDICDPLPCADSASGNTVAYASAIGGFRDMSIVKTSGVGAVTAKTGYGSDFVAYNQDIITFGTWEIIWDGDNITGNLDHTGLGGIDLGDGGTNTDWHVGSIINDQAFILRIEVFTDAGNWSFVNYAQPASPGGSSAVIPLASFSIGGGATGADFANVGAIRMFIDGSAINGLDVAFDYMTVDDGTPTAVSLQNVSANSTDTLPTVGLIAFALLAIVGTGVALTRRQRA